ncbi:AraC family transcriptional regulator [Paenibacillus peoriae]|uniref:AraC family transcriptional regulator n=1 Tax=Paenibacillus peoriae TaxID=59893 RepID=UPI0004946C63|nr:AraC family transcriptional regulator [Paenibacillus peoriae]MEC0181546.1 AraC family transcriptional regulator [Paenibacillus peoriae]
MDLSKFISGKIYLNQYVHRLEQNGSSFHLHYWGVMPKHYDVVPHKHSFFEICFVVDGEGYYIDGDCTYSLQKNMMFLSKPDVLHQIKSKDGLALLYVAFELIESESSEEWIEIIRERETRKCSKVVVPVSDDTVSTLLWKSLLLQTTKSGQVFYEEMLTNLAYSLILSLLQIFVPYSHNDRPKKSVEMISPLLRQAKLYICDNLESPLKLPDVARQFHISDRYLSRIFAAELGVSYSEFVQNERIQRAAALLKTTDLSIRDISIKTGFKTVHYFTRVFHTVMGSPPRVFRLLYTDSKTTTYTEY